MIRKFPLSMLGSTYLLFLFAICSNTFLILEAFLTCNGPALKKLRLQQRSSASFVFPDDDGDNSIDDYPPEWESSQLPTPRTKGAPNKLDLYGEDELADLLQLHQQLYPRTGKSTDRSSESSAQQPLNPLDQSGGNSFLGIHDMVMETIQELEVVKKVQEKEKESLVDDDMSLLSSITDADAAPLPTWLPSDIVEKMKGIRAIASDVDGTITGSDQSVHPKTQSAIQRAVEASYSPIHQLKTFFPATGKSKAGAMASLPSDLASLLSQGPGVYIQGLYCVNGDKIVFEKKLSITAVAAAEKLVAELGTSVIAYDGDSLYTNDLTDTVRELHEIWNEPLSKEISVLADYPGSFHKLLICDKDLDKLNSVRTSLEQLAKEYDCVVTQAIPTMLELLPSGCSKAFGVIKLCEDLGIDPATELLAVGDAENDVEMLEMAAIGCAVENANHLAKDAADVILPLTSTDGGAGLAFEVIGGL
ncbi:HAD-like domain containing protein [Nitzschia inconspicua]|uniref:HAD-like domain containing protein n=1 Tax=Nitzschia inconspicua TaxID=303405 RepID=A0A9K3L5K4_9STRA|nr:HAD-like domain containing protein [Nitzschia inconspicua]